MRTTYPPRTVFDQTPLLRALLTVISSSAPLSISTGDPLRILRVGDSITRMTAMDATLQRLLTEAGLKVDFVGAQSPAADEAGVDTDCEGYNGRPIEFFIRHQATYGDEPYMDNRVLTDAIPLRRALETYQPDLILVMVGVVQRQSKFATVLP